MTGLLQSSAVQHGVLRNPQVLSRGGFGVVPALLAQLMCLQNCPEVQQCWALLH